jgi:hypothetical protein
MLGMEAFFLSYLLVMTSLIQNPAYVPLCLIRYNRVSNYMIVPDTLQLHVH